MEPYADVVDQYTEFAAHCAEDSPCFVEWGLGVAGDPEVAAWVATLPGLKKQPNLVFAAARWHGVPAPGPYAALRAALLADDGAVRETILARSTQTNEVGRLATLLPAFPGSVRSPGSSESSGGPLAVIEVGASAGLNLFPDRWGYAWSTPPGQVTLGDEPRLTCEVTGPAPLPTALPDVAWRAGIDLHPLDVTDPDATAWLENLVWPEQDGRRARLRHGIEVARRDPPRIVTGDLLEELPALVAEASAYGRVVVFHSAVIAYLTDPHRDRFQTMMDALVADGACTWVSNEAPHVLPRIAFAGPVRPSGFVLAVDGAAVAQTHGHGRWIDWMTSS